MWGEGGEGDEGDNLVAIIWVNGMLSTEVAHFLI